MTDIVDTIKGEHGFYAEIRYDHDPSNPREDESHFLFVGLPHRRYNIGDEQVKHDMDCPKCEGAGVVDYDDAWYEANEPLGDGWQGHRPTRDCDLCEGQGNAVSLDMLERFVIHIHEPLHIRRVGMGDHSRVWYYLGGGPASCDPGGWDSGTCGWMLYTQEMKDKWGGDPTPEELDEQMKAELEEYTDWCNGSVYGVQLYDANGDALDAECWGLVGEYAWEYAREELANCTAEEAPEPLRFVPRMTERELNVIVHCLRTFDPDPDGPSDRARQSALTKLYTIVGGN